MPRSYGQDDISRIEEDGSNKEEDESSQHSVSSVGSGGRTEDCPTVHHFRQSFNVSESYMIVLGEWLS